MQSLFNFIVKPKNERYDNKKYIGSGITAKYRNF
jgi:hypothetical protein